MTMGLIDRLQSLGRCLEHAEETGRQLRYALTAAETEIGRLRRELENALRENAALRSEQGHQ
jgi:regulator of replication initiation timing